MTSIKLYEWSQDDEEEIYRSLGRTKNMVEDDIRIIQTWMKTQPHLPEIMDENTIRNMLVIAKGSIEKTKQKIEAHYILMRIHLSNIFQNGHPDLPHLKQNFDLWYALPLPKLTKDRSRVYILKLRDINRQREMTTANLLRHSINFAEIHLKESFQMKMIVIIDMTDVTADVVKNTDLVLSKKAYSVLQKSYGGSYIKAAYFINVPPIALATISFFKTFLKDKYIKKINYCKSATELIDIFPKEILPKDYGGEEKSLEEINEVAKLKFAEYRDRFDKFYNFKIDPKLIPSKLENDEFLGFYGNFKKLDLD